MIKKWGNQKATPTPKTQMEKINNQMEKINNGIYTKNIPQAE